METVSSNVWVRNWMEGLNSPLSGGRDRHLPARKPVQDDPNGVRALQHGQALNRPGRTRFQSSQGSSKHWTLRRQRSKSRLLATDVWRNALGKGLLPSSNRSPSVSGDHGGQPNRRSSAGLVRGMRRRLFETLAPVVSGHSAGRDARRGPRQHALGDVGLRPRKRAQDPQDPRLPQATVKRSRLSLPRWTFSHSDVLDFCFCCTGCFKWLFSKLFFFC